MNGMKASTIKAVLNKKLNNWISTINDEALQKAVSKDVIVSGGAIASMLLGEEINDYDVYFRTFETTHKVAEYYVKLFNENVGDLKVKNVFAKCNPEVKVERVKNIKNYEEDRIIIYMKSSGVASETQEVYQYFENGSESLTENFITSLKSETIEELAEEIKDKKKPKYRPIFLSDNAITLSDKIQLVIRFYGEPDKILNNYDFSHCMNYYDLHNDQLTLHPKSLQSLLSKSLVYEGSLYPIASLFRIRKFIERGWRITAGQILKIVWQVKDIDLNDMKVLREQLIGVDQAYMHELLQKLGNKEGKVDSAYISKLLDEIFE